MQKAGHAAGLAGSAGAGPIVQAGAVFETRDKIILIHVKITFRPVALQAAGHAAGHAVLAGAGPVQAGAVWRRRRPVAAAAGDLACQRGWATLSECTWLDEQSHRQPAK